MSPSPPPMVCASVKPSVFAVSNTAVLTTRPDAAFRKSSNAPSPCRFFAAEP